MGADRTLLVGETCGDVLLRSKEAFKLWKSIGIKYMFLGIEAIDEDGLRKFRKRVPLGRISRRWSLLARSVAINLIADPDWDKERFAIVREWCMDVPEIVNISVNTPYPGTESWVTEERRLSTRDYRLFDIQHAVLPTRLPLREFYDELLTTQHLVRLENSGAWSCVFLSSKNVALGPGAVGACGFCPKTASASPKTKALATNKTRSTRTYTSCCLAQLP